MRKARILMHGRNAGSLIEIEPGGRYRFEYDPEYDGPAISLTLPVSSSVFEFDRFPPFFDGLLPEGVLLDALLRQRKLDRRDYFGQLAAVGSDMIGAVTVEEER